MSSKQISLSILPILYSIALFGASALMFMVEPYIAKKVLPGLGGSANVWNTCVVFFQLTLVAGYLYTHLLTTRLKSSYQRWIHLPVLLLPLLTSNLNYTIINPESEDPTLLLGLNLLTMIGALFFSLATIAPLLIRWYTQTSGKQASDPYFLYAASNTGSIIGLLSYPLWIESNFSLAQQAKIIYSSYLAIALLIFCFALASLKAQSSSSEDVPEIDKTQSQDEIESKTKEGPRLKDYALWLFYTAVPASLMLGVTTYVSTELSSIPFFWVIPLLIYLVSFVIAFSRPPSLLIRICSILAPFTSIAVLILIFKQVIATSLEGAGIPITAGISLHLITLFLVCLAYHGRLAQNRPVVSYLTGFFLTVSIGGMIGSCINTFLAPLVFTAWIEYPIMIAVSAVALIKYPKVLSFKYKTSLPDNCIPVTLMVATMSIASWKIVTTWPYNVNENQDILLILLVPLATGLVGSLLLAKSNEQLRYGAGIALAIMILNLYSLELNTVYRARNFFGCLKVSIDRQTNTCQFWHGITVHGTESLDPALRGKPQSYFHQSGPIAETFSLVNSIDGDKCPVAVVGLGCGTLAAYGKPEQKMVFYEINPDVVEVAENPFYFTYLFQAKKRNVDLEIIKGDGRIALQKAPYSYYKLIVLDAFNSDSIPTHLLTQEALELYFSKLKNNGVIAFQVTNNYYDLKPQLYALAKESGVKALFKNDYNIAREEKRFPTEWVILSSNENIISELKKRQWLDLESSKQIRVWTDDYSNPLKLLTTPFS